MLAPYLDYQRRPNLRHTDSGTPYWVMERFGMPRIPDVMMDAAVYLYPSVEDAKAGKDSGGTGCVIIHPHKNNPRRGALCIVTNKHVVQSASVPRLNRKDGKPPDCLPIEPHDWMFHRGPHDVAILLGVLHQDIHKYTQTPSAKLVSREMAAKYKIGVGDEVYKELGLLVRAERSLSPQHPSPVS